MYSLPEPVPLMGIKINPKANLEAAQMVAKALRDCIPPTIPLPFSGIQEAKFLKRKRMTAKAVLEMFDGKRDSIQISLWTDLPGAWSLQWLDINGSFMWEEDKWVRIDFEKLLGDKYAAV